MKTIYRSLAVVVCISLFLSGCKDKTALSEKAISFFAMDTSISVRVYGVNDDLLDQARNLVDKIESEFSVTQPGSDVSRLNQQGKAVVSSDVAELLTKAAALGEETHGAFDITVYPLVKAWGFTTGAYRVPSEEEIGKLLPLVDYEAVDISGNFVSLSSGAMLDFGGIAKGYTAEKLVELLKGSGVTSAVLDLGGHIQTIGAKPDGSAWRVAVRSPDGSGTLGILEVKDQAVVTSGGYERYFEDENGTVTYNGKKYTLKDRLGIEFPVVPDNAPFSTQFCQPSFCT